MPRPKKGIEKRKRRQRLPRRPGKPGPESGLRSESILSEPELEIMVPGMQIKLPGDRQGAG